jgi:hypothetical protein
MTTKGLKELTPEMDCDQTEMGLPSVTFAGFLIAKLFLLNGVLEEFLHDNLHIPTIIFYVSATP